MTLLLLSVSLGMVLSVGAMTDDFLFPRPQATGNYAAGIEHWDSVRARLSGPTYFIAAGHIVISLFLPLPTKTKVLGRSICAWLYVSLETAYTQHHTHTHKKKIIAPASEGNNPFNCWLVTSGVWCGGGCDTTCSIVLPSEYEVLTIGACNEIPPSEWAG